MKPIANTHSLLDEVMRHLIALSMAQFHCRIEDYSLGAPRVVFLNQNDPLLIQIVILNYYGVNALNVHEVI